MDCVLWKKQECRVKKTLICCSIAADGLMMSLVLQAREDMFSQLSWLVLWKSDSFLWFLCDLWDRETVLSAPGSLITRHYICSVNEVQEQMQLLQDKCLAFSSGAAAKSVLERVSFTGIKKASKEEASSELARSKMVFCKAFHVIFIRCLAFFRLPWVVKTTGRVITCKICTLDFEEEGKKCLQLT